MGPESFAILFNQLFTTAPLSVKYYFAPQWVPWYNDVLAQLNCSVDPCADLDARIDAIQAAIDEMTPYLTPPGGGGVGV